MEELCMERTRNWSQSMHEKGRRKIHLVYAQTFVYDEKNIAHNLNGGCQQKEGQNKDELNEIKKKYTGWMWSQLYD